MGCMFMLTCLCRGLEDCVIGVYQRLGGVTLRPFVTVGVCSCVFVMHSCMFKFVVVSKCGCVIGVYQCLSGGSL